MESNSPTTDHNPRPLLPMHQSPPPPPPRPALTESNDSFPAPLPSGRRRPTSSCCLAGAAIIMRCVVGARPDASRPAQGDRRHGPACLLHFPRPASFSVPLIRWRPRPHLPSCSLPLLDFPDGSRAEVPPRPMPYPTPHQQSLCAGLCSPLLN